MKLKDRENLNSLFLYHGTVLGATRTTMMSLNALIKAVNELDTQKGDIMAGYAELVEAIRTMQPRLTALNHMLEQFEEEVRPYLDDDPEALKRAIVKILKEKVRLYESRAELVVRQGMQFIEDGDGILVLSASWIVRNILVQAKKVMLKDFTIIVLQLDPVRTPQIVRFLREEEIPHKVIPAFNLCHYVEQANKILLGAVSITRDMKVVAPVGTSSTLSLCRYKNIKSYLFANSFHFSHGHGAFQSIHCQETSVADSCTSYHLTTHSHDLVDMELIDVLVDEDGIVDNERLSAYAG